MSKLNLAHVPAILEHMSISPVFGKVLLGNDTILFRLTAQDDQTVLIEGFKPLDEGGTTIDPHTDRGNNIVGAGRKESVYGDFDRTVEGHNDFTPLITAFRDCLFEQFRVGAEPFATTRLNVTQLLKS